MTTETRMFRRTDSDFPTTPGARQRLIEAGRVEGEGPLARQTHAAMPPTRPAEHAPDRAASAAVVPVPAGPCVPLGETDGGTLHLDLNRLLAGRCLIQGSSGAGKSATLRHLIEEAHDYLTTMIVDPEGEFANLAAHIGAATIRASEIPADGLTAAALRARHHRLPVHLDLTDLEPDNRIGKAAAFFASLLGSPREDWAHTVLVAVDEAHLLAPHVAGSARDAETRRHGVAVLVDLCARGRKRGIAPVIATQRLAKLAPSVISELQNMLLGLNVSDRDVARAAGLLGFGSDRAAGLRELPPGAFYAVGPALCPRPTLVRVAMPVTTHVGATPELLASADVTADEAHTLLGLDALREVSRANTAPLPARAGIRALDEFLLDQRAGDAARIVTALRKITPNATTAQELAQHLAVDSEAIHGALDLLAASGAVDTMPRDETRIARLSARVRLRVSDTPVVGLA